MSIEKVREYFRGFGMEDKIREFPVSSATVELAAQAVGCEPGCIVKTLSFDVKGTAIVIAMAGDAKVDNAKYKNRFGVKAKMLKYEDAPVRIGHAVGGVCPFAVNEGVEVYLDESIKRFPLVYPAAGSSNSAVGLTIAEMEKLSRFDGWVDVCKGWQEEAQGASPQCVTNVAENQNIIAR